MKLGRISEYLLRAGRAHYVTIRPHAEPYLEKAPMKFCKDCLHFVALGQRCNSPVAAISLVTGTSEPVSAFTSRSDVGFCGPEGRHFEADTGHFIPAFTSVENPSHE